MLNQGANMLALCMIFDKSYYDVHGVIEQGTFCIHNAIYEEISSNKEEIGIARTIETIIDDVEFYKDVEDLQKSLQSLNIEALSIDQKIFLCVLHSKLRNWMITME